MKKSIIRMIFTFSVVLMSLFVVAFTCNNDFQIKLNDDLSTNFNSGGGAGDGGTGTGGTGTGGTGTGGTGTGGTGTGGTGTGGTGTGGTGTGGTGTGGTGTGGTGTGGTGTTTATLVLAMPTDFAGNPIAAAAGYVKIKNNVVYLNAKGLADRAGDLGTPNSDSRDDERGFFNAFGFHTDKIFQIRRSDNKVSLFFVNRAHVTTNTIAILGAGNSCNIPVTASESSEETLSKTTGGGTCRFTAIDPTTFVQESISFDHYLGTVFGNTVASEARGSMGCTTRMVVTGATELGGMGMPKKFTETTTYARPTNSECSLAVLNSAVAGSEGEEIDDAWANSATATKEIDLYAIAVDISGKTISEFLPAADNFNIAAFNQALDNATMKKMLDHSGYLDLSFKVKIVTSTEFAAL